MMRVTTLYARSARATAEYYTRYLTEADGELPGRWAGGQSAGLGLRGRVSTDTLEAVLAGLDPATGRCLGGPLEDRFTRHGTTIPAVAGFDATLSAPKSLSLWWGLTGDDGLAACHDRAVAAVLEMIERVGATTRVRSEGRRLHVDTNGVTAAVFRQSTSRADDPNLHTHVVISSKVSTADGRWLALDARVLKKHQRALGGLYQSVLRSELTARYGVAFHDVVNGQAEIAGISPDVLATFSKRAETIDVETRSRVAEFVERTGRDPSVRERAAIERATAADTRGGKSDATLDQLRQRWRHEAADLGIDPDTLTADIAAAARRRTTQVSPTVGDVVGELAGSMSAWHRMDVLRTICDLTPPRPGIDGDRWVEMLDAAVVQVMASCIDLDPAADSSPQRGSDGRSVWIEPVAARASSHHVLAQEEHILAFATEAQMEEPTSSASLAGAGLDPDQYDAAAAVAGIDRLVLIAGPAGAGKTAMLAAAVADLHHYHCPVVGVAPTAKAARVLETETGMYADTIAKVLHDLNHPHPNSIFTDPGPGTTIVVDEAGMVATADLHQLVVHAEQRDWRLVLVGDPHQLQAVGRGGMFHELCDTGRTLTLDHLHRFTQPWEAAASLQLRAGNPHAIRTYHAHGRIHPGTLTEHLDTITHAWTDAHANGETMSITTTRNDDVHTINTHLQRHRLDAGDLDPATAIHTGSGDVVMVGDVIATRRNDRHMRTTSGEAVRNRQRWIITDTHPDGQITITQHHGQGTITLPADYVDQHVELAYATTEHGAQGETTDHAITLATASTTGRGLYVAMTRGRDDNTALVLTDTHNPYDAIELLEASLHIDRADIPATRQRRDLHATIPQPTQTPTHPVEHTEPGIDIDL